MSNKKFKLSLIYLLQKMINVLFSCGIITFSVYFINILILNPLLYPVSFYISGFITIVFATLLNILAYKNTFQFKQMIKKLDSIKKQGKKNEIEDSKNRNDNIIYLLSGKEVNKINQDEMIINKDIKKDKEKILKRKK